jgi:hypothetical protein
MAVSFWSFKASLLHTYSLCRNAFLPLGLHSTQITNFKFKVNNTNYSNWQIISTAIGRIQLAKVIYYHVLGNICITSLIILVELIVGKLITCCKFQLQSIFDNLNKKYSWFYLITSFNYRLKFWKAIKVNYLVYWVYKLFNCCYEAFLCLLNYGVSINAKCFNICVRTESLLML